jgi:biotin synthase
MAESTQEAAQPLNFIKPVAKVEASTWPVADVLALFDLPFNELLHRAQETHRAYFPDGDVELATLLSIKTGGCEEDCGYCPQAARYDTGVEAKKILGLDEVLDAARQARANGATRFCMGAAWRSPKDRDMEKVETMVREVKALGMETCATLGMLEEGQAQRLADAGLDYYNHNLDTAPEFYGNVISTRDVPGPPGHAGPRARGRPERLLRRHRRHGRIAPAARRPDRAAREPESVSGIGAGQSPGAGRGHAAARPAAAGPVRIRAHDRGRAHHHAEGARAPVGRPRQMGEAVQAMCFLAGANSIFYGDKLLTTENPEAEDDRALLAKLGLKTRAATLEQAPKERCGG